MAKGGMDTISREPDFWHSKAIILDCKSNEVTVFIEAPHPATDKRIFTLKHREERLPSEKEYWRYMADVSIHRKGHYGSATMKRIETLTMMDESVKTGSPPANVIQAESNRYRQYCEAAVQFGLIFPPPKYSAGAGRAPGRYRHLKNIYKQYQQKASKSIRQGSFDYEMENLRSLGILTTPRPTDTLKEEFGETTRSVREFGRAIRGTSEDQKYLRSQRKAKQKLGRSKGTFFPGIVSTVDSIMQVDDENSVVTKTSKQNHQTNFINVQHKRVDFKDFKLQAKSIQPFADKKASSVLHPLKMWVEGVTSTTKVFKQIWSEVQELIKVF
jgi:hypothetical protein